MACPRMRTLVILLYVTHRILPASSGSGTLYLRLIKYENTGGLGNNGHCCDGKWGICQHHGCDHKFTICLDQQNNSTSTSACMYSNVQTHSYANQDTVLFESSLQGGHQNPMHKHFADGIPPVVSLKVDVYDYDSGITNNEFVDFLQADVDLSSLAPGLALELDVHDRTSLDVEVWLECDEHWYGQLCDVMCHAPLHWQHYTCDPDTGDKLCQAGWEGQDCHEEDACFMTVCLNEGICHTDNGGEATCLCQSGFTGNFCENIATTLVVTSSPSTTQGPPPEWIDRPNADCDTLAHNGFPYEDGVYELHPSQGQPFAAYCAMEGLQNGGWTVIQRRSPTDSDVSFDEDWFTYKHGFGQPGATTSYWVGLENIYWLTNQRQYALRVYVQKPDQTWAWQEYTHFYIDDEAHSYTLHVSGSTGNAGDALNHSGLGGKRQHNGMPFSTYDRDNDQWQDQNCAETYQSGWWFNDCYWANLNGVYKESMNGWANCDESSGLCVAWLSLDEPHSSSSLRAAEMAIIPIERLNR